MDQQSSRLQHAQALVSDANAALAESLQNNLRRLEAQPLWDQERFDRVECQPYRQIFQRRLDVAQNILRRVESGDTNVYVPLLGED